MKRLLIMMASLILLTAPAWGAAVQEKCLSCHEGIEKIADGPVMGKLSCTDCHQGNAGSVDKKQAHTGMYSNPSDLRVADKTCGTCHPKDLENARKSLHATSAGKISGTRYAWGAQDRKAIYGNYPVENPGAKKGVTALKGLPSYDPQKPEGPENSPADDYLRNQCLRCHIGNIGAQQDGDYRASGCAACHVVYSDTGAYEGSDKAIPKGSKGRPSFHRITNQIPVNQCLHCHNRGGRTGVSFIGDMESDNYGSPYTATGDKQSKLHGKNYNHLKADVHYDKGLACIDCHTKQDLHGDGNIYEKREQAVEVSCQDCHGTMKKPSNLKTSWGNPFNNLKKEGNQVILTAKVTGKKHQVPQIADISFKSEGYAAMVAVGSHMNKLECYACHAKWAPQCYGCHAKQNIGKKAADWLSDKKSDDPSKEGSKENRQNSAHEWEENRSYLRWETPVLGVNSRGKVSPFIPGCQVIFTQVDGNKSLVNNKVYTTKNGTSGISTNPVQPHTVTKESRSCASKAMGLGSGIYDSKKNGLPIDFELERIVDENGKQIQGTSRDGARPFNKSELQRVDRTGTCVACHGADSTVWKKTGGKAKAPTDELHNKAIKSILKKSADK